MDALLPSSESLREHVPFVRALARGLIRDQHAAEDVAQETWLRFLRRPPREPGALRTWLRRASQRLVIEERRVRSRRAAREERAARPEALASAAEELAQAEVSRTVVEAVLALDEPYRTTVLLVYWRGWDARRIAAESRTPLATVRSRLQRAHQRLRERLDRTHGRAGWIAPLTRLSGLEGAGGLTFVAGAGALVLAAALAGLTLLAPWRAARGVPEPARDEARAALARAEGAGGPPGDPRESARTPLAPRAGLLVLTGTVADGACEELGLRAEPAADLALKVTLSANPWGHPALATGECRTDGEGRFALELAQPEGALHVLLSSPADEHHRGLRHRAPLLAASAPLALVRAPHGVLHGRVLDAQGQPCAGLQVEVGQAAVNSDAEGRFALASAQSTSPVRLLSRGVALLGFQPAHPLEEGGYSPLEVRVGPEGTLRLRVVARGGAGLPGAEARLELPASELAVLALAGDEPARSAKSDADGWLELDGLWAGRKLRLTLRVGGEQRVCEAMADGRLLLAQEPRGRPLLIEPGTVLELTAHFDVERDVAGRVRLDGGEPVPRARVEVSDLGRGDAWSRPVLLRMESDAAGRFAGRLRASELLGPLRVSASAPEPAPRGAQAGLGYVGASPGGTEAPAAELELAPGDASGLAALELTLAPRFEIRGTLRGRDGAPLTLRGLGGSRLWAARAGSAYHGHGVAGRALTDVPGGFRVAGLPAGEYELFVSEELESFYSFENFLHRFPAVAAGAQNVELRLPERREVHVRVRLHGGTPRSTVVLTRKLFPAREQVVEHAPARLELRGALGWPEGASLGFTGIGGSALAAGRTSDGYDSFEGGEFALRALEPGWYAFGVHAAAEGALYYPQATPVLWFDEGEYLLEVELLPAATVRGRLLGDGMGEFLAVALVDARGRAVSLAPLAGYTRPATILDTAASGAFVLHHAPSGAFRLRAGTRAQLERGEFTRELALEIRAGPNEPVELRL